MVCSEGLKENADLLVNLQSLEDTAQLKIETENVTAVTFIDGNPRSFSHYVDLVHTRHMSRLWNLALNRTVD